MIKLQNDIVGILASNNGRHTTVEFIAQKVNASKPQLSAALGALVSHRKLHIIEPGIYALPSRVHKNRQINLLKRNPILIRGLAPSP